MASIFEVADRMVEVKLSNLRGLDIEWGSMSGMTDALVSASAGLKPDIVGKMPPGDKRLLVENLELIMEKPSDHPEPELSDEGETWDVTLVLPPIPTMEVVKVKIIGFGAIRDGMTVHTAMTRLLNQALPNVYAPSQLQAMDMGDVSRIMDVALPSKTTQTEY